MLLSELVVENIGPFASSTKIRLEETVTVLTGTNDCGKTSVLNAIELVCGLLSKSRVLQEQDVNVDRIGKSATDWKKDSKITCEVVFDVTDHSHPHVGDSIKAGGVVKANCQLAPDIRKITSLKFRMKKNEGGWSTGGNATINSFPTTIRLPLKDPIGSVIDLKNPNHAEMEFLRAAFGAEFNYEKYEALSEPLFSAAVSKARGDTNAKLKRFLPPSISLEFDFQHVQGERHKITVQLRDNHEGHTPLAVRGSGIQRLVSLMGALLSHELDDRHYIILLDEPENSLHADAQHSFRSLLEALADKPSSISTKLMWWLVRVGVVLWR